MEKITDTINRINEKMKERAAEADAKKQKQAEEVKKAADDVAALEQKARAAGFSGNDAEYKKAYKAAEDAKQLLSMKRDRLATLESTPLVTREEYENAAGEIRAEYDAQETEARAAIIEHLQAIAEISNGLFKAGQEVNNTMANLANLAKRDNSIPESIWSFLPAQVRDALQPLAANLHVNLEIDPPRLF